jgi:L-threonylcarbamoyladenylate synthase
VTNISKCSATSINKAVATLLEGNLVAFPTETVYGLGADPNSESAIKKIYIAKGRPENHPLIIHISSVNLIERWISNFPIYASKLAKVFWPGPMTLILPRSNLAKNFVTGGQNNVGIRVPAHECAQTLLKEFEFQGGTGIAAPSANRFGKVSPTCARDVQDELQNYISQNDMILDGGFSTVGIESTIINCTQKVPIILRPGAITKSMIEELIGMRVAIKSQSNLGKIKASGLLKSHYSPNARVLLSGTPKPGDGLIALANVPTPAGVIRLASPTNCEEYAQILYKAFRSADIEKLPRVFAIPPRGNGIASALRDRLKKSAFRYKI